MSKERIRKLAKRLERSPEEVFEALHRLGETRYKNPDDTLPDDVVSRVEKAIKSMPRAQKPVKVTVQSERFVFDERTTPYPKVPQEIPDDPTLNAALKDYLAAKPLEALKQNLKRKEEAAPAPAKPILSPAAQTEAMLRDSLGAEIRRRREAQEGYERAMSELAQARTLAAQTSSLQAQLQEQQQREQQLSRSLLSLLEEKRSLEDTRQQLERTLSQLQAAHAQLQQDALTLKSHGEATRSFLSGEAEKAREETRQLKEQLVLARERAALAEARVVELTYRLDALASAPPPTVAEPKEPRKDARPPSEQEDPPKSAPASLFNAMQAVPQTGREEAVRLFKQVCHKYQVQRLNVVGGSPQYHRQLEDLLAPEIDVRAIDGTAANNSQRARHQVEGADLTMVWAGSQLLHRVSELYTSLRDKRVVIIAHRGLEGMLRQLTEYVRKVHGEDTGPA